MTELSSLARASNAARGFLAAAAALSALVGVEAYFRHQETGVDFLPDERLYRSAPGQHGTNSAGFHERELRLESGELQRIAVLGDSMTWGQGTVEETWPRKLEGALGAPWQVLNFARYGSDLRQQLATLPEVWQYQPKQLLVGVYWNDAIPNRMIEVGRRGGRIWLEDRSWFWFRSGMFRAVQGAWASREYQPTPERGFVGKQLAGIRVEAVARDVPLTVVLLWPHTLARGITDCAVVTHKAKDCLLARDTTRWLAEEIGALGIPMIDTLPALVEPNWPATHPQDWEHPGREADARIGSLVAAELRPSLTSK